jgi:hypothetical protein
MSTYAKYNCTPCNVTCHAAAKSCLLQKSIAHGVHATIIQVTEAEAKRTECAATQGHAKRTLLLLNVA